MERGASGLRGGRRGGQFEHGVDHVVGLNRQELVFYPDLRFHEMRPSRPLSLTCGRENTANSVACQLGAYSDGMVRTWVTHTTRGRKPGRVDERARPSHPANRGTTWRWAGRSKCCGPSG